MELIYFTPIAIVLTILGFLLYQFFIKIYLEAFKYKKMDPNLQIFIAPFIGILGLQRKCFEKYGDTHHFIKQMIQEDPDLKAYFTNLGNRSFLILCDAKLIQQFSLSSKKFRKLCIFKHIQKSYTKGIFFVEDQQWKSVRNIINHSFNHNQLKKMMPVMGSSTKKFIQRIHQQINQTEQKQKIFSVIHESQLLIGQILVRTFFSQDATKKKVGKLSLSLALAQFSTNVFDRSRSGSNVLATLLFGQKARSINFSKQDKSLEKLIDEIRVVLFEIINQRIENYSEDEQKDFLHHYIREMKQADNEIQLAAKQNRATKSRKIEKQQILHQLVSFYFAGIDTTGHLVAFALYSLAQYPEYKQTIIKQINELFKTHEDVTYENLQKMTFMNKFLDECLRMWPPATGIMTRVAREDLKIGPYNIPKGMCVGTNIIGLMHNPKYYKNPSVFNPYRWDNNDPRQTQPYSFIPFSAGSRSCVGKYLALMESKLILINFIRNFDIKRSDTQLRLTAKFLYEPIDDKLVILKNGGSPWQQ